MCTNVNTVLACIGWYAFLVKMSPAPPIWNTVVYMDTGSTSGCLWHSLLPNLCYFVQYSLLLKPLHHDVHIHDVIIII